MLWLWIGFVLFVLAMLALDLGVFHRTAHVVTMREALTWSAVWVALGLAFSVFIFFGYQEHWMGLGRASTPSTGLVNDGRTAAVKYVTGYVVEKSLSVDNVFVIAMVFLVLRGAGDLPAPVLFWGGSVPWCLRGLMIAVGASLIAASTGCSTCSGLPDPHRRQDAGDQERRDRPQPQPGGAPRAPAAPGHRALPR